MKYSKTKVNRAGATLSDVLRLAITEKALSEDLRKEGLEALEIVEWWRSEHARPLSQVAANLRYYAADEGKPIVAQRLKKAPTIAHKLLREPGMKLSRMGDIGGVRAVLPNQDAAYRVARRLRRNWTITRFRDYVMTPKPDGYRALHLINRHRGRLIEVQLRTSNQHLWADAVETVSRATAPNLKFGDGPPALTEYLRAVALALSMEDRGQQPPAELLAEVKDLQKRADTFMESRNESG